MSTTTAAVPATEARRQQRQPHLGTVLLVELRKLVGQTKVRVVSAILLVAPWIFILLVLHQDRLPLETLYGRYLKTTGFATPMVVLVTATQWLLPLIASFACGDIFSSENGHGTLKTLLTRSVGRSRVFWCKVLAGFGFTCVLVMLIALSSMAAGLVTVGAQPMVSVGGTPVPSGQAAGLVLLSWASVLPAVLGFASLAMCVSILTRNSVLGVVLPVVVGLVFQMYMFLNAWDTVRHLLLNFTMNAWRGLLDDPSYAEPMVRGALVALVYVVVPLVIGLLVFRRRDVTGG